MTVYNLPKSLGIEEPTLKDKNAIGVLVAKKAREENITFTRVKQKEDNWEGFVNNYEDRLKESAEGIVAEYFIMKDMEKPAVKELKNKIVNDLVNRGQSIVSDKEFKQAIKTPTVKRERKRIPVRKK